MITIVLLHPIKKTPIRTWTFDSEPLVRIGRSRSNDVVISSAIVSRHHVELWRLANQWEVVSFGANGTFIGGDRVHQVPVVDGTIVQLGNSGPKLCLQLDSHPKPSRDLPSAGYSNPSEPPSYALDALGESQ